MLLASNLLASNLGHPNVTPAKPIRRRRRRRSPTAYHSPVS